MRRTLKLLLLLGVAFALRRTGGDGTTNRPGDGAGGNNGGSGRPSQKHGSIDASQGTGSAHNAIDTEAQQGRPTGGYQDAQRPGSGDADTAYTGGTSRPRGGDDWDWAEDAYSHWRNNNDEDVDLITDNLADAPRQDGSTGFTREEIALMKDNVMRNIHPIDDKYEDGAVTDKRFDADPEIAAAWIRMQEDRPTQHDIALLEHEIAEARYWQEHPEAVYSEAHEAANQVSDWENSFDRDNAPYEAVDYSNPRRP
ncbi:hypothetical protein L0U85_19640 [Glycomyces sp. L485]|uniref:hypothetical protein n=1 Tax=Glycomyces sp. L485 TaxID=2909235 RepID=UPI001F4B1071|nr:hypothetical protein [Glycomyces sp. L485]MCH7233050.1 hypothetical protein [Glycomyces sp. L485]